MNPSVKTIETRLNVDHATALKVRRLLDGRLDPNTFSSVQQWERQCFNPPSHGERVECALNEVLGGHGIEAIRGDGWDSFYGDTAALYVNQGDTYAETLLYDIDRGKWLVTTVGDWIEREERNGRSFP